MTDNKAKLAELAKTLEELERRKLENRLAYYEPYAKQRAFHELGASRRERLLMAGNQLGKTIAGGAEAAMHATGRYSSDWKGRRFMKPTHGWTAGVTAEGTRDNPQRILLGPVGQYGTGMLPKDSIKDVRNARGIPDSVDTVLVKHVSGGVSHIGFKSYEKGREKLQGATLDWAWLDEEPPLEIYSEVLARIAATQGMVFITFTPLLGMSEVVRRFLQEGSPDRGVVVMTIEDALHIPAEERERIIQGYPAHEREARINGVPMLGSGRVFPVAEEAIREDAFAIPAYWPRIAAIDFGWDHPFAAVWLAWDRDADVVHVTDCYRAREETPILHAAAINARGSWIPVAWPHDGMASEKGTGDALAAQYKKAGVKMLPQHAQFVDGGNSVEAGVSDMLQRAQTGRLKVAAHLHDWWEEFRLYHRKDGRIVKEQDDLMSASRYGVMMLRYARTGDEAGQRQRIRRASGVDYDVFGDRGDAREPWSARRARGLDYGVF